MISVQIGGTFPNLNNRCDWQRDVPVFNVDTFSCGQFRPPHPQSPGGWVGNFSCGFPLYFGFQVLNFNELFIVFTSPGAQSTPKNALRLDFGLKQRSFKVRALWNSPFHQELRIRRCIVLGRKMETFPNTCLNHPKKPVVSLTAHQEAQKLNISHFYFAELRLRAKNNPSIYSFMFFFC